MIFSLVPRWEIKRSYEHCCDDVKKKVNGVKAKPLVNIPFDRIVVDTLHMFLRIMGKLFNQVTTKIQTFMAEECSFMLYKKQ